MDPRVFGASQEQFYVAIKFARVGRISVATKLATTKSSTAHDRVGRARRCGARFCHDIQGHARAIDLARRA